MNVETNHFLDHQFLKKAKIRFNFGEKITNYRVIEFKFEFIIL
jgi:hypothetical protein